MRIAGIIVILTVVATVTGCTTTPRYTQAQLNAIETREVDAEFKEAFNAASNAMFDAGYTISMSDREGGLLTGSAGKDNTSARIWVSPYIQDTRFVLSVQVRETGPKLSTVRVKTSVNGEPRVDLKAINNFWHLMQRQVLMKDPPDLHLLPDPVREDFGYPSEN